jgi:phenylacetate-CoA ligase
MERAPGDELAQFQAARLEQLLRYAHANSPYYRGRLTCLMDATGKIDLSKWNEVPVTTRADVVANSARIRVAQMPDEYGPVAEFQTSGTLGTPLTVAVNGLVSMSTNAALARMARWFGLDPSRALASIKIFPGDESARYPAGKKGRNWIVGEKGPHFALDVSTPISQQLEWLSRVGAPYLLTYPSNAWALAEAVTSEQGRAMGIEAVFGFAETVPDGARELVAERFGARSLSYYSCQEIGVIALECPMSPHYHLATENVVLDLLDEDGRMVRPGERGLVVVTGLNNYAMPFIRYSLADVAVASGHPCTCGRSLPVIERIEGRVRNAFSFRDGTRIWPRGWLVREMRAFVPFRQYQMVQLDFERIELRYVPDGTSRTPDINGLSAYARKMMHPSVEIALAPMDALPRGPSGKFEDFISFVLPSKKQGVRGGPNV